MSEPRAPGLQPERTALAWRRTLLAMAAGALVAMRLLSPVLGGWAVVIGLGGVVVPGALWVVIGTRQRRALAVLTGRAPGSEMPGGGALGVLALLTAAGAAFGLLLLTTAGDDVLLIRSSAL